MHFKCIIHMQAPPIGTFGSANASVGTSLGDRAPPAAAMVGMVSVKISATYSKGDRLFLLILLTIGYT